MVGRVEESGGEWRGVEESGGEWRGGEWRGVEGSGSWPESDGRLHSVVSNITTGRL